MLALLSVIFDKLFLFLFFLGSIPHYKILKCGQGLLPCDLGEQITISHSVLRFGIIYSICVASGTPGVIAFGGQLAIGKKIAAVKIQVSHNPSKQLPTAEVKALGVLDLVKFVSLIADREFTKVDKVLHFITLDLY